MKKTIATTKRNGAGRRLARLALAALIIAVAGGSAVSAKVFVSFNGKFRITYPDEWRRADYRTVDYYLQEGGASAEGLQYEAVFSPHEGGHFADDVYFILCVDTVGELSESRIDSVLKELGGAFGEGLKYFPEGDFMTDLKSNAPVYDPENRTVSIMIDVTEAQEIFKKSLFVMKFYERGIANFYFYAPDSLFEQSKPIFADILASFSTENLEAALPEETVKVADLESRGKARWPRTVWLLAALVVLLVAISLVRRSRRKTN